MNIYYRICITLACILFVSLPAPGQDLPTSTPRQLHVSAEKLQQGVQLFRDAIADDRLRNVELLVLRDGHIILHEALGWQNKNAGDPLRRHTIFRMASNTKAVIATGILLLQQDGKLSVHDPVGKYLPAFRNKKCRDITISHLLTHTSGFRISSLFLKPLMEKCGFNQPKEFHLMTVSNGLIIRMEFLRNQIKPWPLISREMFGSLGGWVPSRGWHQIC